MADATACEVCENINVATYFCSACTSTFCGPCWPTQIQHRPGKKTLDGRPHIKESKAMIERMHSILEPPQDAATLKILHEEDQDTRWFGVVKSQQRGGASQFRDFRRYAQLMLDSRPLTGGLRYPKLISFIGDTNAGKSTIVKALVSQGALHLQETSSDLHQMPVPGSTQNEGVATSEGVHLYADPALLESEKPLLYADCEGLNAGERPPFATEVTTKADKSHLRKLPLRLEPKVREILWSKSGDPVRGTREFAVGQLYPRFLYTFSDAIVFVQKNPKQIHLTYKYLVDWAKFNVEESLNQPILPHAIVVLNAVDMGGDDERQFFHDVSCVVNSNADLSHLAGLRDIKIHSRSSARQLLQCFYSEVHVIRIPAKRPERYTLIDGQIGQLRRLIIEAGEKAHHAKTISRRLSDVDTLQEYLQAGFDHFAANIDQPFDFKGVSLRIRVIAQDFGDHIINLASTVQEHSRIRGKVLFRGLVSLVTSCILLDYVRHNLPGPIMDYFPSNYAPLCKAALYRFCDEHVPCEFTSKKCAQCMNVKSTHIKGHQNANGKITPGAYQSSFNAKDYENEWFISLKTRLQVLEEDFNRRRTQPLGPQSQNRPIVSDLKVAVELHGDILVEFFSQSCSGQQCFSNHTCFGCLMAIPESPLACGHALCKSCINEHGDAANDLAVYLKCCPLHPQEPFDWAIPLKPEFAGIRVLTLDGGGIRGIVELEVLRAIETRINVGRVGGCRIPVQRFFDLIVGTSTGGIIALGLTAEGWSVDHCIAEFRRLCNKAFSPREFKDTKFEKLVTLNHGSKWRTTPLHDALKESLGHQPLFGGQVKDSRKYSTKVAVVSTSQPDCRSLLITNYNREEATDPGHSLELPDDPRKTLKTWEAGAATSAAPSFFKPFECHTKTYLDGALNHNNPVVVAWREKNLIWPDVLSKHPDLLLSLGTGQNKREIDSELAKGGTRRQNRNSSDRSTREDSASTKNSKRFGAWQGVKNYFSVLVNKLDNILDTERAWDDFFRDIVGGRWSTEASARYIRLNLDLKSAPPALDQKEMLETLHRTTQKLLQEEHAFIRQVEDVTNRLVASSFYFKKLKIENDNGSFTCSGSIHSKFHNSPHYIEPLGLFLRTQLLKDFVPKFIVTRRPNTADVRLYDSMQKHQMLTPGQFNMDKNFIDNMITKKEFFMERIFDIELTKRDEPTYICLQLRLDNSRGNVVTRVYPISGFPRRFMVEKERNASRLQRRKAAIDRRKDTDALQPTTTNLDATDSSDRASIFSNLVRSASATVRSGSASPPESYDSLSNTDYESTGEIERQESISKMADLNIADNNI
ncbi:MAG: hypothetical protein M1816_006208 [Peltula sp. TS41687]|nr:MAG: hypothetical protein M1816_006208 [Peltula sp. TS41687]